MKFQDINDTLTVVLEKFSVRCLKALKEIQEDLRLEEDSQSLLSSLHLQLKLKSVLQSYQIIVIDFAECCEIFGLQDLGKSLLKMYVQIVGIVGWILTQYTKQVQKIAKQKRIEDQKQMKRFSDDPEIEKQYFRFRQNSRFLAQSLEHELHRIEKGETIQSNLPLKKIHELQQVVHHVQPSSAEALIRDATKSLTRKNSYLESFISMRTQNMKNIVQDVKIFQKGEEDKQERVEKAINKLWIVFKHYLTFVQIQKKQKLIDFGCQVIITPEVQVKKQNQDSKIQIKNKNTISKLTRELKEEKSKCSGLEKLIKQKTDLFQKQLMTMRMEIRSLEREKNQFRVSHAHDEHNFLKLSTKQIDPKDNENFRREIKKSNRKSEILREKKSKSGKRKIQIKSPAAERIGKIQIHEDLHEREHEHEQISMKSRTQYTIHHTSQNQIKSSASLKLDSNLIQFYFQPIEIFVQSKHPPVLNISTKVYTFVVDPKEAPLTSRPYPPQNRESKILRKRQLSKLNENIAKTTNSILQKKQTKIQRNEVTESQYNISCQSKNNLNFMNDDRIFCLDKEREPRRDSLFISLEKKNSIEEKKIKFLQDSSPSPPPPAPLIKQQQIVLKNYKIKSPEQKIKFTNQDLLQVFLTEQKALQYEFLNYTLVSYRKNPHKLRKSQPKSTEKKLIINRSQTLCSFKYETSKKQEKPLPVEQKRFLNILIKHLLSLHQCNTLNYHLIRSFLRFPHSLIHRSEEKEWKKLNQFEHEFTVAEVKRIYHRIKTIHSKCGQQKKIFLCKHLDNFFSKIGLVN